MREFGQLEGAIMDVIWSGNRPYSVREVRERMEYDRPVAYTTVMTVMGILHGKDEMASLRRAVFSVTADRAAS